MLLDILKNIFIGFCILASAECLAESDYGTFLKPFAINSLWNSRPVNPEFDNYEIPASQYFPALQQGKYSTGVFLAKNSDQAQLIYPATDKKGVWDPDSEEFKEAIKIDHWPSDVLPAEGSDGHADIVDEQAGVIHSFWQLKNLNGRWQAVQYAWTALKGRGWGDPAHYFQGARAAAVPSLAGLIRQHEIDDGKDLYEHALAISLTYNALSPDPSYVFPATSADSTAATTNTGQIPEGALLMLPDSFDLSQIQNPKLQKVAKTLKTFGGYVVDRNYGTPFVIYVENGSKEYSIKRSGVNWDNQAASEAQLIRANLRRVISTSGWVNGKGVHFTPDKNLNLLSMRGPWKLISGTDRGKFDSLSQSLVFPKTRVQIVQENNTSRSMQAVSWAKPAKGEWYKLSIAGHGEVSLTFKILEKSTHKVLFQSKELKSEDSETFSWPAEEFTVSVVAKSRGDQDSSIRGSLIKVP